MFTQPGDALRARLEIESQRSFNRNSPIPESLRREDTADDFVFFLAVFGDLPRLAVLKTAQETQHVVCFLRRDLPPLVAQAPAHRLPESRGVDKLHLALTFRGLAVAQNPHIGCNAGVVEKLLRQRNQRLQQVILHNVTANFAFAAACITRKQGRAVHDDRDARASLVRHPGVSEHVQQEQCLTVADAREPRAEAPGRAPFMFGLHRGLVAFPVLAVGRIRDQVIKMVGGMPIV